MAERLPVDARLRKAIAQRLTVDELRDEAVVAGLSSMREKALPLVQRGVVGFDELPQLLPPEQLAPRRVS